MIRRLASIVLFAAAVVAPAAGSAQATPKVQVPAAYLPPKGMCRIWLDGVAADKQPAPTDCATALKNKPATGQVVFPAEESARPTQNSGLRQQGLQPPGAAMMSPARLAPTTRPSSSSRDTSKAVRDSIAKARKDTLPRKPPPPSR